MFARWYLGVVMLVYLFLRGLCMLLSTDNDEELFFRRILSCIKLTGY